MNYTQLNIGDSGQNLVDTFNGNFLSTDTTLQNIAASILLRLVSNNVKQVKVESGKMYYTLDDTNWTQVDNNTWGSITGSIDSQLDLKNKLDLKANVLDLNSTNSNVNTLTNEVSGLKTRITTDESNITSNTTAIGALQSSIANKISSSAIVSFRISASGFLEYTLDNVTWKTVQSISDVVWGSVTGLISNQVDLKEILDTKLNISLFNEHKNNETNPHGVTKSQVGLSNVDNTSDVNKPISSAVQSEITSINQTLSELNTGKLNTSENLKNVKYVTLEQYNTMKSNNTLVATTMYIVD